MRQRAQRGLEHHASHRVEDDVGALVTRPPLHVGREVAGGLHEVVDSVGHGRRSLRATVGADHPAAAGLGDLNDRAARSSTRADHDHGLARTRVGVGHRAEPRDEEVDADARRDVVTEVARLAHQPRDRNGDPLRVSPVHGEANLSSRAPHLRAYPLAGALLDDAREVAAGHPRQDGALHLTGDVLHVAGMHASRDDADDGRRRVRARIG